VIVCIIMIDVNLLMNINEFIVYTSVMANNATKRKRTHN
jgi:hypothetical protein